MHAGPTVQPPGSSATGTGVALDSWRRTSQGQAPAVRCTLSMFWPWDALSILSLESDSRLPAPWLQARRLSCSLLRQSLEYCITFAVANPSFWHIDINCTSMTFQGHSQKCQWDPLHRTQLWVSARQVQTLISWTSCSLTVSFNFLIESFQLAVLAFLSPAPGRRSCVAFHQICHKVVCSRQARGAQRWQFIFFRFSMHPIPLSVSFTKLIVYSCCMLLSSWSLLVWFMLQSCQREMTVHLRVSFLFSHESAKAMAAFSTARVANIYIDKNIGNCAETKPPDRQQWQCCTGAACSSWQSWLSAFIPSFIMWKALDTVDSIDN